jgi:signal transduction histidine kinase
VATVDQQLDSMSDDKNSVVPSASSGQQVVDADRRDARATAAQLVEAFRISPSFLCLLRGPEHVFEMANEAYSRLVGARELIGRPVRDALPEVVEQGFITLLDEVFRTGEPFHGAVPVRIARVEGAALEERYVDFVYQALTDAAGQRTGIAAHGYDVTEHVLARREVERLLTESEQVQEALEDANTQLEEQQAELETTNQQLQENAVELEVQAEELEATAEDLVERIDEAESSRRRARFVGEVGLAITHGGALPEIMQRCCQAAVDHLDAAFARVWVLDPAEQILVLTASAGLYTHLNGPHGRVPMGQFKIGQIAAQRRPHLTNSVIGDPRVPEQAWAAREGLVAFAGYPLVVWNDIVGVMAMFAKRPLSPEDYEALGTGATAVSVTISNVRHLEGEQRARRAAEAAEHAKAEFLATMSHELRTPLNAIGGYVELLDLGIRGPVTAAQRLDLARIQQSQQHLLGLINQILDLAKDDAGALRVDRSPVRTGDTVDAALALVRPQAVSKALDLGDACGGSANAGYIGDELRVRQILVNLLGNAVKFTSAGGRILVDCAITEAPPREALLTVGAPYVGLRVADTGLGIPSDQMGRIFEPFTQVEGGSTAYTRPAGGTGLGLAISRRLARLMGGDLTVESRPGEGSAFTLWLPAVDRRARPRRATSVTPVADPPAEVNAADRRADHDASSRRATPIRRADGMISDLTRLAEGLVAEVVPLVHSWVARLRTDAAIPDVERLPDVELEDHAATLVTDVALALRFLDGTAGALPTSIRDGTAIMNVIGERHGAQRARLGWTESALARECAMLAEEVDGTLGRIGTNVSAGAIEQARRAAARLLEQAMRVSLGGFRLEELGGPSTQDSAGERATS